MPEAKAVLGVIWANLDAAQRLAVTQMDQLRSEIAANQSALATLDALLVAWTQLYELTWQAEAQFHPIKVALGLE